MVTLHKMVIDCAESPQEAIGGRGSTSGPGEAAVFPGQGVGLTLRLLCLQAERQQQVC